MRFNRLSEGGGFLHPATTYSGVCRVHIVSLFQDRGPHEPKNSIVGHRLEHEFPQGGPGRSSSATRWASVSTGTGWVRFTPQPRIPPDRTGLPNFRTRWLQGRDTGIGSSNHLFLLDFKTGQA